VLPELALEHPKGRLEHGHRAVGVAAGAATLHFVRPAVKPVEVLRVPSALGQPRAVREIRLAASLDAAYAFGS
jgi:hypothetical protein